LSALGLDADRSLIAAALGRNVMLSNGVIQVINTVMVPG